MDLERVDIRKNIIHPVVAIAFINFILMMIVLVLSSTIFARPSGVEMGFPLAGYGVSGQGTVIMVTGEDVIYINNRVVTLNELRRFLGRQWLPAGSVLTIKADARASMGRVAEILNLCRDLSGARVNVSTIL
jgi:biopolymer transport protein ExbD